MFCINKEARAFAYRKCTFRTPYNKGLFVRPNAKGMEPAAYVPHTNIGRRIALEKSE
jgi:hypothetical protein